MKLFRVSLYLCMANLFLGFAVAIFALVVPVALGQPFLFFVYGPIGISGMVSGDFLQVRRNGRVGHGDATA